MVHERRHFQFFLILFAFATYVEQLMYPRFWGTMLGQVNIAALILAFFYYNRTWPQAILLISVFLNYLHWLPFLGNHTYLEWWMAISLLTIICLRQHQYSNAMILMRWYAVGMYVFAALAKLNRDFLNPLSSCAARLSEHILQGYFNLPPSESFAHVAIYGTIILEIGIPLMLCIPRLRHKAIVLGIALHFFFAIEPNEVIFSYSFLMLVLYFPFLSDRAQEMLVDLFSQIKDWAMGKNTNLYAQLLLIIAVVFGPLWINGHLIKKSITWLPLGVGCYVIVSGMMIWAMCKGAGKYTSCVSGILPRQWALILFIAIFIVNGLAPYLGLKTQGSFIMYSNLSIKDDTTNHLFVPVKWKVFPQGYIHIHDSNLPVLRHYSQKDWLITPFEFRRRVTEAKNDFYVRFSYNGNEEYIINKVGIKNEHPLLKGLSWFEQKFMRFKEEQMMGPDTKCEW